MRQIMDYSRKTMRSVEEYDISQLLNESINILKAGLLDEYMIELAVNTQESYMLRVDASQFDQMIINLVFNARDAMPDGGKISVSLDTIHFDTDQACSICQRRFTGKFIRIAIKDQGIGMSDSIRAKIFEPFFTTKDVAKGIGLGLSQVYGIVTQYSGHIQVESALGKGSVFSIYLPSDIHSTHAAQTVHKVLLAEDEPIVLTTHSRMLDVLGYEVIPAINGLEALDKYKANPDEFLLVVTDMKMPEMNGQEPIAEIREIRSGQKVLVISGYAKDTEIIQHFGYENLSFLYKPTTIDALRTEIQSLLNRKKSKSSIYER